MYRNSFNHSPLFIVAAFCKRRGIVLVLVLWILVVLTVLTLGISQGVRIDNMVQISLADRLAARWLARAGVHQAISVIAQDNSSNDSTADIWYRNDLAFYQVEMPQGVFSVISNREKHDLEPVFGVTDEAARLNLNVATAQQLTRLPGMTQTMAEAVVQWRNNRKTIHTNDPHRYCFSTIRQLAWIDQITPNILYGEDYNLNGILDINENDGPISAPDDNQDDQLDKGILAYLTVYSYEMNRNAKGQKRFNLNTASPDELTGNLLLKPEHINWIIANRPFLSIADLLDEIETKSVVLSGNQPTDSITPFTAQPRAGTQKSIRPPLSVFIRIADSITVTDDTIIPGRININTAGPVVLKTLSGINELLAGSIIKSRQKYPQGFDSIAGLLSLPEISITLFKKIAPYITVRSNVFTIRSVGCASRTGLCHNIEAVVDRGRGHPSVIYWKETP